MRTEIHLKLLPPLCPACGTAAASSWAVAAQRIDGPWLLSSLKQQVWLRMQSRGAATLDAKASLIQQSIQQSFPKLVDPCTYR